MQMRELVSGERMEGRRTALRALLLAFVMSGCKSLPPPTVARGTVKALATANPDQRGRPSPVVVRIYELKSIATFESADFFSLFDKDQATLGPDLAGKDEFTVAPNGSRPFERTLQPGSRYIAALVAYREIERSRWRAVAAIVPASTNQLTIEIGAREVTVKAQ